MQTEYLNDLTGLSGYHQTETQPDRQSDAPTPILKTKGTCVSVNNMGKKKNEQTDRRSRRRFNIEQGLRYRLLYGSRVAESGIGQTANISSNGVWFTTDKTLGDGLPVELSMNWPVRLNDVCLMKLMIYGCVVRSNAGGTAMTIERYEFRTQGAATLPLCEEAGIRLPT